jgi:DNA (cytosine-5)-methyltransferase 1
MLECGLSAGLEYLGFAPRVLGYVERDAYAATVLLARMADAALEPAPVWCGDFADMDASSLRGRVDCIAAGFPCQPWSAAGKQQGTADERWLWPGIANLIGTIRPRLIFLENVPGLLTGGGLDYVLSDLAAIGFDAEWCHLAASAVGASHKRERVFILAWLADAGSWAGRPSGREHGPIELEGRKREPTASELRSNGSQLADTPRGGLGIVRQPPGGNGQRDGVVGDTERDGGRFDLAGRGSDRGTALGRAGAIVAHTERSGLQNEREASAQGRQPDTGDGCGIFAPGPGDGFEWGRTVADGSFDFRAPAVKPGIRVLVDGVALVVDASRADQLRCGGNGVVPLQAAVAFVELVRRVRKARERDRQERSRVT